LNLKGNPDALTIDTIIEGPKLVEGNQRIRPGLYLRPVFSQLVFVE